MVCLVLVLVFFSLMKFFMVCLIIMWCLLGRGMFVVLYDGGFGGGVFFNLLFCWFNK